MSSFNKAAHQTKWIPVKQLSVVWASAQREFDEGWAKHLAATFDPDMFGELAVTLPNGNGIYHVIDGQHRKAAVQALYGDEEKVPCRIFDAVEPARAAEIFDKINTNRKKPQPIDVFKTRVTAGYEVETAVNKITQDSGYRVSMQHKDGMIGAVNALVSVYRSYGPKVLADTLRLIQATWGLDPNAVTAPIIRGYGAFVTEYGNKANWGRLTERVSKKYSPGQFMGAARSAREFRRGSMADAVTYVLINTYNAGLKTGHIGKEPAVS